jgi:hypothetical protein
MKWATKPQEAYCLAQTFEALESIPRPNEGAIFTHDKNGSTLESIITSDLRVQWGIPKEIFPLLQHPQFQQTVNRCLKTLGTNDQKARFSEFGQIGMEKISWTNPPNSNSWYAEIELLPS